MEFQSNNIFVMSKETWEWIEKEELEFASTQPDPIKYILNVGKLDIVFDDTLSFGITEMWTRDKYEKYMKEINGEE